MFLKDGATTLVRTLLKMGIRRRRRIQNGEPNATSPNCACFSRIYCKYLHEC